MKDTIDSTWLSFFMNWGPFVGVLIIKALLLGVCMRDPDFWKLQLEGSWHFATGFTTLLIVAGNMYKAT